MIRKWISFVMMLAFVVTTMPTLSYAAMSADTGHKAATAAHAKTHKCCHEAMRKAAEKKTASNDCPASKKSCCDGKDCKCLGNACGASKVLGFNSMNFLPLVAKGKFGMLQDRMVSSLSDPLKRPPRA